MCKNQTSFQLLASKTFLNSPIHGVFAQLKRSLDKYDPILCLFSLKRLSSPFCYEDTMVYMLTMLSTQRLFDDIMKN